MIETIQIVLFPTLLSILIILFGFLIDSWFIKIGAVQESRKPVIALITITFIFIKAIWYQSLSWWVVGFGLALAVTLGVHRYDLNMTFKQGWWWWKSKKKSSKRY